MVDEECKKWASMFIPCLEGFRIFDFSELQRDLKKINDEEELANWFNNFNLLRHDEKSLFKNFSLEADAFLYEFMKRVLSLGKDIVFVDHILGGSLVGRVIPDEEKPSVVVNWFEYNEDLGINDDFSIKICRSDNDDCDIHVTSNNANHNSTKHFVSLAAGRIYGFLNLAIEDNKMIDNNISHEFDGYSLLKKM